MIEGFRIIELHDNPELAREIQSALSSGHLWLGAIRRERVGLGSAIPDPTHLIFMDAIGADAEAAFHRWQAEQQGS